MSSLLLPRPDNMVLSNADSAQLVESDVFDICNRIRTEVEGGANLYIVLQEDMPHPFVVMERCADGFDRMVKRYDTLDPRVIKDLQYMNSIPLNVRVEQMEKQIEKDRLDHEDERMEEAYENMGRDMWKQLDDNGFIDGGRGTSFAKRGATRGKGSRAKS